MILHINNTKIPLHENHHKSITINLKHTTVVTASFEQA